MRALLAQWLLWLVSLLPLRFNHALGGLLGRALYHFSENNRRLARRNIALCFPEWDEAQREQLVKTSLREMGKAILESGPMWRWSPHKLVSTVTQVSGDELLEQAMAEGRGVILALPHLGSWEVLGIYGSMRWPMTSLYRPPRLAGLDEFIRQGRERAGATLVPTDASGVRALYKALGRGELLAILPDQDPGDEGGVFAPFFGIPANTMTLLPRLAHKSRAVVLFAYAERLPEGRGYHLHFSPAPKALAEADVNKAAAALNAGVESCVRQLPEQYQWSYKRFKRQPAGQASPY